MKDKKKSATKDNVQDAKTTKTTNDEGQSTDNKDPLRFAPAAPLSSPIPTSSGVLQSSAPDQKREINDNNNNNKSGDDDDENTQGHVAIHVKATSKRKGIPQNTKASTTTPKTTSKREQSSNNTPSSWADGRQRRWNTTTPTTSSSVDDMRSYQSAPPLPRTKTPTMSNVTEKAAGASKDNNTNRENTNTTSSTSANDKIKYFSKIDCTEESLEVLSVPVMPTQDTTNRGGDSSNTPHSIGGAASTTIAGENEKTASGGKYYKSSSFKSWLTRGILDVLNTAAGFTISTTGTIVSPTIPLLRDVILPETLAIVVDMLDNMTPPIVQDWVRIITSSIHHLYTVLKATPQGKLFRKQLLRVIKTFMEALSAPESRQVVIDGVATGIKLADALHTPEMEILLEQTSVLACRFVDALSSGRTKQFIQNSKNLAWQGIELAVDPATTTALAEVTAHLCHALEELDDSLHTTPRPVRNAQNEGTYLDPLQMTDYEPESIENIILSSLGIDGRNVGGVLDYDMTPGMADDLSIHSVPSNVAFQDMSGSIPPVQDKKGSIWAESKKKVNVSLLQDRLSHQGRPQARPYLWSGKNSSKVSSATNSVVNVDGIDAIGGFPDPSRSSLSKQDEEEAPDLEDIPKDVNFFVSSLKKNPNVKELGLKLEEMVVEAEKEPAAVQFFQSIDRLIKEKRAEKEFKQKNAVQKQNGYSDEQLNLKQQLRAQIRKFRDGTLAVKPSSRAAKEKYANLRRLGKYPPVFLYINAMILAFVVLFWILFAMYGMYTFYQVAYYKGPTPYYFLHPLQDKQGLEKLKDSSSSIETPVGSNEIVIRIVKETGSEDDGRTAASLSEDEVKEILGKVFATPKKDEPAVKIDATSKDNGKAGNRYTQKEVDQVMECITGKK